MAVLRIEKATASGQVVFLADSESQVKPAYKLAAQLAAARGSTVVGNLVPNRSLPSPQQLDAAKIDCELWFLSLSELFSADLVLEQEAIVAFLSGSQLYAFLHRFRDALHTQTRKRRPILITGYNGVVYEKHLEGLLWRVGCDLICVNSLADQERFGRYLGALGCDPSCLVRTGPVLAQGCAREVTSYSDAKSKDILFAPQAVVPRRRSERTYLLQQLIGYAVAHPDRGVLIKPRAHPGDRTFHVERDHYADLAREEFRELPPNLRFVYGDLQSYLPHVGLVVTISSTAAFEAIASGVQAVILTDLGIKETLGNHFFLDSGMLATMDDLMVDRVPGVAVAWLERNGFHADDSTARLVERAALLLESQARSESLLPLRAPYYDDETAPFIYRNRLPAPMSARARKMRKLRRRPFLFVWDALLNAKRRLARPVDAINRRASN